MWFSFAADHKAERKKKKVPATKNRQSAKIPKFGGWHLFQPTAAAAA
jgi:hypothetical protein